MMILLLTLSALGGLLAVVPAGLFFRNLFLYRLPPRAAEATDLPSVSLLIPARNEERGIGDCVRAALASRGVNLEVIVLDDHSNDGTQRIVEAIAQRDPRVRVEAAPPLPPGWCGKQHACHALAERARHPLFAFIDADVRLTPDGLAEGVAFQRASGAALVSGIPRQETGTPLEKLLIPLIHFLMLSYLPIARMRRSKLPAYGAGCGQFFLTDRGAYAAAGGHAAIRASLHDGIALPRAYRRAGQTTDLFDATRSATCRMYRSASEVWRGLSKNATEGIATRAGILPWSFLLLAGQVLPWGVLLAVATIGNWSWLSATTAALCIVSILATMAVRITAANRFRQPLSGALLHPVGILLLLAIQWTAFCKRLVGRSEAWKGRNYGETHAIADQGA